MNERRKAQKTTNKSDTRVEEWILTQQQTSHTDDTEKMHKAKRKDKKGSVVRFK